MPRFAANLSMLFTEQDFLARFKAAKGGKLLADLGHLKTGRPIEAHGGQVLITLAAPPS